MRRLILTLVVSALSVTGALADTGWFKVFKKHKVYYKPFVDVKTSENILVLFITEEGRVYKGRCKSKLKLETCAVTPGKIFPTSTVEIRYIVLKLNRFRAPEVIKTGVINGLNVIEK